MIMTTTSCSIIFLWFVVGLYTWNTDSSEKFRTKAQGMCVNDVFKKLSCKKINTRKWRKYRLGLAGVKLMLNRVAYEFRP